MQLKEELSQQESVDLQLLQTAVSASADGITGGDLRRSVGEDGFRRLAQENWIAAGASGRYAVTSNGRAALKCLRYLAKESGAR